MRILVISNYFAPAWGYGGPTRLLYELTSRLASLGHDVTVLTTDASDSLNRYGSGIFFESGVRIIRLCNLSQHLAYRHKKFIPLGSYAALSLLMPEVDVIHAVGSRTIFTLQGASLARKFQVPYVLAAYGSLPTNGAGWKRVGKPVFDLLFTRQVVRNAQFCLAQTLHERDMYVQFGAQTNRIRMVPLAADGDRFRQLPSRGGFRQRFGLSASESVILFVGRIHPSKGLDILVRSVRKVIDQGISVRLVVVGRDDGHERYVRYLVKTLGLEQTVLFVGPMYGNEVVSAYVDADVFALTPRHFEETTLAGIEACFCGTQVIVTEEAEIPYLAESGGGVIVNNQIDLIAQALMDALADEATIRKRGEAARALGYSKFDWKTVLPRYVETYADALQR